MGCSNAGLFYHQGELIQRDLGDATAPETRGVLGQD